ncbi:hypothetical protein SERLA73DRAFT_77542 [Serpula lacrymans var. lacrymans S7.3]|uniref:Major facilitator superfamily (MFS) profile domain-containing protein n=1 Tax=Serpula lacrymans var. lacrymans (strain S7.3) TaxID=936435 RepID=F8QAL5_SERL3|nr:hypothetical protein SERLA73DRAFT_77542 [Serpula lacrymans var. lacrymans S7.3]
MAPLEGKRLYYTINLVAGLAIFFFGYDQGMMGGVNTSPDYVKTMGLGYSTYEGPSQGYVVTITNPTRQGGIVSIYYFGTLIGCLMGGVIGDRMLCARVINGIGTGHLNAIVPVWSAEVATHTSRGAFIAMEFTLNIFGVVVAYWLEFGLGFVGDGSTQVRWRFPIAFQIIPIVSFMIALLWMPESPRWLVKAGRVKEAEEILRRIRATKSNDAESDARIEHELNDITEVAVLEKKHARRNSYWSMFWGIGSGDLHIARRVQLSIWLQIVQEWVGIAAITVYAPTIFAEAGYSPRKSQWLSGLNDITYMLSTLVAVVTIDRWGRRVGLWWERASEYGGASAFFIFVYTAVFGATWLTIPWVYPTETFPLEVRAKGNAWGVVGWSIGNGWLTLLNPVMFNSIHENTLHIFGAINFLSIPMVWAFYPETANRTLEEIDLLFASKSPFVWEEERHFRELKELGVDTREDHVSPDIGKE